MIRIREINSKAAAATAVGLMNALNTILCAVSDPLTGKILDIFWKGKMVDGVRIFSVFSYKLALSVLPLYLIIAIVLMFFIKDTTITTQKAKSLKAIKS